MTPEGDRLGEITVPRRVIAVAVLADTLAVGGLDAVDELVWQVLDRRHVEREPIPVGAGGVVLRHEQTVVDPEVGVGVGAIHLLKAHADEHVLRAVSSLSENMFSAALDARRADFDVVLGELHIVPLAAGQHLRCELVDRLGGLDAGHQRVDGVVGERDLADGVLALDNEITAVELVEDISVDGGGGAAAVGQRCECVGLGVAVGIGVRIGGDAAGVDLAVPLAGEVGECDIDLGTLQASRADELAQLDGVVVGTGIDGCAVESDFGEARFEIVVGFVGEVGCGVGAFVDSDKIVVAEVERRAGDGLGFAVGFVGQPVDWRRFGRRGGFQHREL